MEQESIVLYNRDTKAVLCAVIITVMWANLTCRSCEICSRCWCFYVVCVYFGLVFFFFVSFSVATQLQVDR